MRFRLPESPLELRVTYRRLRKCTGRRKLLLQLLFPVPWHFAIPPQSPPSYYESIDENSLQPNMMMLRWIPLFRMRDTPLRSLYRLYEDLCAKDLIMMGYEADYFFNHTDKKWKLCQMPDPQDPDPTRYAVLASMVEALVSSFNWKLEVGLRRDGTHNVDGIKEALHLETRPAWTADVKPLPETLRLGGSREVHGASADFLRRNIEAPMGYLYNV
ncbi:uncharacterized protein UV8b_08257 [Ustilaginoidea virens]|nr:uncharacterized protein UV8b_08257 [Ustilaginoidea virens]QUC24016.1 hypothetical protein UV8b_08257 [Ustilaginoidea virens]